MHIFRHRFWLLIVIAAIAVAISSDQSSAGPAAAQNPAASAASAPTVPRAVVDKYCITCHSQKAHTAGLDLETMDLSAPGSNGEAFEKIILKLRAGSMPPPGQPRPDAATYRAVATTLENMVDREWAANPNPGRIGAVQRLNRAEYNNAIRDLLALDIDVKPLLPGDDTADGSFDNFADSLSISTAHLERYMSVARQVTRLATGLPPAIPAISTFEIPLHVLQDDRQSEDLPFGSRGGIAIQQTFPVDGEYLIKVRLQRQYQDYLKGMGWPQQLDVRLDGKLLKRFSVGGKATGRPAAASFAGDGEPGFAGDDSWEKYMQVGGDAGLEIQVPVNCGSSHGWSVLRERAVGTGRSSATVAARHGSSPTTRCTWTTRTWARSRLAVPTNLPERRKIHRAAAQFSSASPKSLRKNKPVPRRSFQKWHGSRIAARYPRRMSPR